MDGWNNGWYNCLMEPQIKQRFFRNLCVSLKVPCAIGIAKAALLANKSVVIGLQSTGETGLEQEIKQSINNSNNNKGDGEGEGELSDFISSPGATLNRVIYRVYSL